MRGQRTELLLASLAAVVLILSKLTVTPRRSRSRSCSPAPTRGIWIAGQRAFRPWRKAKKPPIG
jgi:hypothetical protein